MASASHLQSVLSRLASTSDSALTGVLDKLLPRLVSAASTTAAETLPQLLAVIEYIKKRLTANPAVRVPFGGLAGTLRGARGGSLAALGTFLRLGKDRLRFPQDNAAVLALASQLDFKDQSSALVCEVLISVRTILKADDMYELTFHRSFAYRSFLVLPFSIAMERPMLRWSAYFLMHLGIPLGLLSRGRFCCFAPSPRHQ
jgi:hypothetical protein